MNGLDLKEATAGDRLPAAALLAAAARLSDRFRQRGHPFVKVSRRAPVIDHPSRTVDLVTGKPYFREEGVEHNVVNASPGEFVFIEIEVKR